MLSAYHSIGERKIEDTHTVYISIPIDLYLLSCILEMYHKKCEKSSLEKSLVLIYWIILNVCCNLNNINLEYFMFQHIIEEKNMKGRLPWIVSFCIFILVKLFKQEN